MKQEIASRIIETEVITGIDHFRAKNEYGITQSMKEIS
jgi:hypothetical protein